MFCPGFHLPNSPLFAMQMKPAAELLLALLSACSFAPAQASLQSLFRPLGLSCLSLLLSCMLMGAVSRPLSSVPEVFHGVFYVCVLQGPQKSSPAQPRMVACPSFHQNVVSMGKVHEIFIGRTNCGVASSVCKPVSLSEKLYK